MVKIFLTLDGFEQLNLLDKPCPYPPRHADLSISPGDRP